jgi:hypothetical protein
MKVPNIVMPLRLLTKLYTLSFRKEPARMAFHKPQTGSVQKQSVHLCVQLQINLYIYISYPWHQEVTREMDMVLDSRNRKL